MTSDMIQEVGETAVLSPTNNNEKPLLSIQDLHVWYELKRWGFAHAG